MQDGHLLCSEALLRDGRFVNLLDGRAMPEFADGDEHPPQHVEVRRKRCCTGHCESTIRVAVDCSARTPDVGLRDERPRRRVRGRLRR